MKEKFSERKAEEAQVQKAKDTRGEGCVLRAAGLA